MRPASDGEVDGDERPARARRTATCGRAGPRPGRASGRRSPTVIATAGSTATTKQHDVADRGRGPRAGRAAGDDRHREHRPEQPAHPVPLDADGAAVTDAPRTPSRPDSPATSTAHRDADQRGRRAHSGIGSVVGVEVHAGRQRRRRAGCPWPAPPATTQAGSGHRAERDLAGDAPAARAGSGPSGRSAAAPRRSRAGRRRTGRGTTARSIAGQGVVGDGAEPDVGLRQPVERPEQAEPGERPAEAAGRGRAQHDRVATRRRSPGRRSVQPTPAPARRRARGGRGRVERDRGASEARTAASSRDDEQAARTGRSPTRRTPARSSARPAQSVRRSRSHRTGSRTACHRR